MSEIDESIDRIRAALADPVNALAGDSLTLCGTDVQRLLDQWENYRKALWTIAAPSFMQVGSLKAVAREVLDLPRDMIKWKPWP
jgi:hypothetical protein